MKIAYNLIITNIVKNSILSAYILHFSSFPEQFIDSYFTTKN